MPSVVGFPSVGMRRPLARTARGERRLLRWLAAPGAQHGRMRRAHAAPDPSGGPRGARSFALALCLALAAGADGAEPAPWSGVITVDETIKGPAVQGGDQHELEHLALVITDRLHQARSQVMVAPPFVARVLREDMGFYEAELERVAAEGGGAMLIGHVTYFIKGKRMLIDADGATLLIDRGSNAAIGTVDGQPVNTTLQPLTDPEPLEGAKVGETVLGYPTKRAELHINGKSYDVDVAIGLPNPFRLGLMPSDAGDDLVAALASYDGLPMNVSEKGAVSRCLTVTGVERQDINDAIFSP